MKKELLKIPFYKNDGDGNQCLQVCLRSVIKYSLDKDYSLGEIDKLTGRRNGKWTYTAQGAEALCSLGLDTVYYSSHDVALYLQGEKYIRKTFGKDADKILKYTDLPVTMEKIKKLLTCNAFREKRLFLSDIKNFIKQGCVPIVLIDNNKIIGKDDLYQGHFVVVTGIDKKYVYYHDSGPAKPEKNKKVSKEIFEEARRSPATKNSVIIICGKNNKNK